MNLANKQRLILHYPTTPKLHEVSADFCNALKYCIPKDFFSFIVVDSCQIPITIGSKLPYATVCVYTIPWKI